MSFWVHAFCNQSVASVTPCDLRIGIARRLKLLTYLFCPEEEDDPELVLNRLRIENVSPGPAFQTCLLYYRADSSTFIRLDRNDRAAATELEEFLCERKEPGIELVRQILSRTTEDVSFCLNSADLKGMGFPLSIAAAAYLVEQSGGLIQSGTYSWMIPDAQEVRILLELEE